MFLDQLMVLLFYHQLLMSELHMPQPQLMLVELLQYFQVLHMPTTVLPATTSYVGASYAPATTVLPASTSYVGASYAPATTYVGGATTVLPGASYVGGATTVLPATTSYVGGATSYVGGTTSVIGTEVIKG
jgi:hypothetical protein